MTPAFLILAAIAVAGTAAAMALRNPIHCILALTAGLTAIAALYLQLGAQFVGLTQLMVYVGAVAILAVFAIMMTHRPSSPQPEPYSLTGSRPAIAAARLRRPGLGHPPHQPHPPSPYPPNPPQPSSRSATPSCITSSSRSRSSASS